MRALFALPLLTALASGPAWSQDAADTNTDTSADPTGPFIGQGWRYGQKGLIPRTFSDLVAVPANAAHWQPRSWILLSAVAVPVSAGMLPLDPSVDARLDAWMYEETDAYVPFIWGMEMQTVLWGGMAVGGLGTWGAAHLFDWPDVAEGMSLSIEALAVSQLYHLGIKLMLGREGPEHGDALGLFWGPGRSLELFPAGTPSGHAATLFSVLGATQVYFQPPLAVAILTHGAVGTLVTFHVLNHRHFASDSLWGSALGYSVGVWVVRHRSTRFAYIGGRPVRIDRSPVTVGFAPWQPPEGGLGLAIGGTW